MGLGRALRSLSSFRREAALTVAFSFSFFVISAIQGPLLARSLGPAERGDLAAVYTPFLTFGWVVALGLPTAAAYFASRDDRRQVVGLAHRTMLVFGIPVAVLLGLAAPAYLSGRPSETVTGLQLLLLVTTLLVPVQVVEELVRGRDGSGLRYNVLRSVRPVLALLLLVALAVVDRLTLGSAIGAFVVATVVGGVGELVAARSGRSRRPTDDVRRRHLSYGLRSAGEGAALTVVARFDQLILAGAGLRAELGLYTVAATLAQLSSPLSIGVKLALLPALQRAEDDRAARRLTIRACLAVGLASTAFAVGLVLTAAPILRFAFGEEFREAYILVVLLLPGEVAYDVANVLGTYFQWKGRPGIASQGMGVAAVATVVLVPLVIGRWGAEGAAVVTSVAYGLRLVYLGLRWAGPWAVTGSGPPPTPSAAAPGAAS